MAGQQIMESFNSVCVYWKWPRPFQRIQIVFVFISCFLFHFSIGSVYTYGNLVPYLVSYTRVHSQPSDLRNTDTLYLFALQVGGLGIGMLVGGILDKRYGPRLVSLGGGLLMSSGVALTYFAIQRHFWILIITYGLMFGVGMGLAYIGPVACAIRWLPNKTGIAAGIVLAGYGISSLIFTLIQNFYINPDNTEPEGTICDISCDEEKYFTDPDLLNRVPKVFLLLGGTYAAIQLVSCICLVNPPPVSIEEETNPILVHNNKSSSSPPAYSPSTSMVHSELVNKAIAASAVNITPLQLVCKPSFYLLWIMFFCISIGTVFVSTLYKSFGLEEVTTDDRFISIAGAVSSCFNLLGRIVWGGVADFTCHKLALVLQGALATCLLYTFYITSVAGKEMFFIWLCAVYFCIGGYYSLYPSMVAHLYGTENVSINYALVYSSQIFGSVLTSLLAHILVDFINWWGMFILAGSLSLVEFGLAIVFTNKRYANRLL